MPGHIQKLGQGMRAKNMSGAKVVGLSVASSGLVGTANNVINQKYIVPKYNSTNKYYTKKLHDGTVVSSNAPVRISKARGGN